MQDNDIIKALECCNKLNHNEWSANLKICKEECPYKANCYDEEKNINMISDTLDLINRQQAEIERLKKENLILSQKRANLFEILETNEKGRIRGIKEFAERLKALDRLDVDVSYGYGREHYTEAIAVNLIDNLVKEIIGE